MRNLDKPRFQGNDSYVCTSVSVSQEEKDKGIFKSLSIQDNTAFVEYLDEITRHEDFDPRPRRSENLAVKFSKTKQRIYDSILRRIYKKNMSFSSLYKMYYNQFIRSLARTKKAEKNAETLNEAKTV